jgi:hypothetical protein
MKDDDDDVDARDGACSMDTAMSGRRLRRRPRESAVDGAVARAWLVVDKEALRYPCNRPVTRARPAPVLCQGADGAVADGVFLCARLCGTPLCRDSGAAAKLALAWYRLRGVGGPGGRRCSGRGQVRGSESIVVRWCVSESCRRS